MRKLAISTVAFAALAFSPAAFAQNADAPGQDRVCLITFGSAEEAQAGADADAVSAKYLPRKAAEAQAAKSGGVSRAFDYYGSDNVTDAGVPLASNEEEREFCEETFNPTPTTPTTPTTTTTTTVTTTTVPTTTTTTTTDDDDDDDGGNGNGGNGNANSARDEAPGQQKGEGESAKDYAPGQDGNGAPGQSKK